MFSLIRAIWAVFLHMFRRRETICYPEKKPYLAAALARADHPLARPGRRRAVRRVLPLRGGLPGDCIALQATEDEHGRRYPEFFRINFSRCIFCGFCEEACPTYAIQLTPDCEMGEYRRAEPGVREGGPADRRLRQVPGLQFLPRGRRWRSTARTRARRRTRSRRWT